MSRYAHKHPEQFSEDEGDLFSPREFDPLFDKYDLRAEDEARETKEVEDEIDMEPYAGRDGLRPCAACGKPTTGHWCSDSCRRAEDGLSQAEADQIDYERGDE